MLRSEDQGTTDDETYTCLSKGAPKSADSKDEHSPVENLRTAKDVAELSKQCLRDCKPEQIRGRNPVLVLRIAKVCADDVHGSGGGCLVKVGGAVPEPKTQHDKEEPSPGNNHGRLLVSRRVSFSTERILVVRSCALSR